MKNEDEAIKDIVIRNIRKLSEHEKEYDYKPFKADNSWSNYYIEYELLI